MRKPTRFHWSPLAVNRLRELRLNGISYSDCANVMLTEFGESFTYSQIEQAIKRYGLNRLLEQDGRAVKYHPTVLPMGDYSVCSDIHAPFHSELWMNRFLFMSQKFHIKNAIVIGDLLDCQFASKWYSDDPRTLDAEVDLVRPVMEGLDIFEKIYWCRGNHEQRIGLMTDGTIQLKHLGRLFGGDVWDKKISYSRYDKFYIEGAWILVHPKSYRQTVVSVARDLASKYHRNIINTHGHFVGMGYDKSGKYLCVDLGGLFDTTKVDYYALDTTTHPAWGNGFGILKNGKFWHFTENSDWEYLENMTDWKQGE